jgi:hypothetical protein
MHRLWLSLKQLSIHVGILLLSVLVPTKIKRITYLTTLHAQLVQGGVFQQELLSKVNQTLQITRDDNAMLLPASIHHRLWDDAQIRPLFKGADFTQSVCLPFEEAKRISEELVDMSPKWLRYSGYQDMVVDTLKLFYCQPIRSMDEPVFQ